MIVRNLALIVTAAVLACGAARGQAPKPAYDEALAAVTEAGCERAEADRYIRFFCEEGEALWYFTREGRPEHAAYFVAPAYGPGADRVPGPPITGNGRIAASSREQATDLIEARLAWIKQVYAVWRADAASLQPKPQRDRGRLYPLEP